MDSAALFHLLDNGVLSFLENAINVGSLLRSSCRADGWD